MIIPVGERYQQNLVRITKRGGNLVREPLEATLFVPMTGAAEQGRKVQPDPLHPAVRNGSFEEAVGTTDQPAGWHYLRQARLASAEGSPAGGRYLGFSNKEPGRPAQGLQGLAIDGRKIGRLDVSAMVRGKELAAGPPADAAAALIVTFYDERRAAIDSEKLGPWSGSFDWRRERKTISVPLVAREAIVRIGLHGGAGELDVDDVSLTAAGSAAKSR